MGYRILTGVLIPRRTLCKVTIYFNPHQISGDADGVNLEELGDQSDFEQPPSGFVSLKHFTLQDRNDLEFGLSVRDPTRHVERSMRAKDLDVRLKIRSLMVEILRYFVPQNDKPSLSQSKVKKSFDNKTCIVIEECQIKNQPPTIDQMVVGWRARKGAEIKEIAYLVMGEV